MISPGAKVRSKVEQPWPSAIGIGTEGRVLMRFVDPKMVDTYLVNFNGEQLTMSKNQIEVIE